jgi:hypothetical protein
MKDIFTLTACAFVTAISCMIVVGAIGVSKADQPHQANQFKVRNQFGECTCDELTRIRLLLEHQFGVVCDERHCEGSSSSGGGSSLP